MHIFCLVATHHPSWYLCEWKGVPCQLTSMSHYSRDISVLFSTICTICSVCAACLYVSWVLLNCAQVWTELNVNLGVLGIREQDNVPLLRLDDKPLEAELCFSDLFAAANANLPLLIKNHGTDKQSRMTSTGGGTNNGSSTPCKNRPIDICTTHDTLRRYAVYPSPTIQQSINRTNHPTTKLINHRSTCIHETTFCTRSIHHLHMHTDIIILQQNELNRNSAKKLHTGVLHQEQPNTPISSSQDERIIKIAASTIHLPKRKASNRKTKGSQEAGRDGDYIHKTTEPRCGRYETMENNKDWSSRFRPISTNPST